MTDLEYMNLLKEYGCKYLSDNHYDDDIPNFMSEFDFNDYFSSMKPFDIARAISNGHFNPYDEVFVYDSCFNTIKTYAWLDEYLDEVIRKEDFIKWLKDKDLIESEEE